jgi:hypothetical protein
MRSFQIRRLAKKGEEMLTAARVSVAGDEVTAQMWTPAVLPVVPRGEEDSDEVQSGEGSSGAWSAGSIASCDGAEAQLEVERAAGASGVRRPWGFATEQSEQSH